MCEGKKVAERLIKEPTRDLLVVLNSPFTPSCAPAPCPTRLGRDTVLPGQDIYPSLDEICQARLHFGVTQHAQK